MNPEFPTLVQPSPHAPDRPPDGGGGKTTGQDLTTTPNIVSFRDRLMGGKIAPPPGPRVDLLAEKLVRIEYEKDNPLLPKILVADSVIQKLRAPWDDALIVRLLGENVDYMVMKNKLPSLWKLNRGMDIMDLGHGYFMVKLDYENDRVKAMEGGPWMMFVHYLVVTQWFPKFHPKHTKIDKTLVWVSSQVSIFCIMMTVFLWPWLRP